MGIFSRKERIPDPQVTIRLEPARNGPYLPGETLSGVVIIQSPVPRELKSAHINFSGQVFTSCTKQVSSPGIFGTTNNTRTIRYEDRAPLFGIDQGLFSNTTLIPEKPLDCPFSFTVPNGTACLVGSTPYTGETARSGIYAATGHVLPPSFQHYKTDYSYANIEYGLQAVLAFDDTEQFFTSGHPVSLYPVRDSHQQPGMAEFIRPPQSYSSSRLIGEEKSVMNSFRDKFASSTPSVNVLMRASLPSFAPTSVAFNIYACVEIDALSMPGINIPSLDVRIKGIKLVPVTFYRALRVNGRSMDRNEHEAVDEGSIQLNAVPPNLTVEKEVDHGGPSSEKGSSGGTKWVYPVRFEARIPGNVYPSFQTFIISRSYRLKVTIEAVICGKEFEHKFEGNIGVAPSAAAW